jgi:hypothetical protein
MHPTDIFPPNCTLNVKPLNNSYHSEKSIGDATNRTNILFESDYIKIDQTNSTNHNFIGTIEDKIYGSNFTITELRINLKNSGLNWIIINEIGFY